jgi:hypothetical protein
MKATITNNREGTMDTRKWTVTLPNGKTQVFLREGEKVLIDGTSMVYTMPVFLAGLEKMRSAGATIVESESR